MALERLSPASLAQLPAAVARPAYERGALRRGIVHLGVGAFQRAHLAAVNEAALHATGDLAWGITGVSLRSPDTRDALAPQAGLYTLALRDVDEAGLPRATQQVVGCLLEVLVAPENPQAVVDAIAHADTRIVSITVTEKGYCWDPASGGLQWEHPDVAHDLAHPGAPRGLLGFLVAGLRERQRRGLGPVTLMSLDNLPSNGRLLRGLVLAFAGRTDPALADWIGARCTFPCSMVDRIVPRTTDADREAVATALGLADAWPVVGERFLDWAVEDDFAAGRPAWEQGGARFVREAHPFETLKLRMVNGAHSALAYAGVLAGLETVDRAVGHPAVRGWLQRLMREEIEPTLHGLPGVDLAAYRQRLMARFANPALAHRTAQIAMDGSQKLPQRLLGTLRDRLAAGASIDALAMAVAVWMQFLGGADEAGRTYAVQDPMAQALQARHAEAEAAGAAAPAQVGQAGLARVRVLAGFAPVFGTDLAQDERFIAAVARAWDAVRARGVLAALEELA